LGRRLGSLFQKWEEEVFLIEGLPIQISLKRRKKQPPKIYSYSSLVDNSFISSELKTQICRSSTSGTILSMYENKSIPLPKYKHYPMQSYSSTTHQVI
jgi:hypothetical protein